MAAKTEKGLKQEIVNLFPVRLRQILEALPLDFARLEEIRMRCGQPILFRIAGKEMGITGSGDLTELGSSGKLDNWEKLEKIREKELKNITDQFVKETGLDMPVTEKQWKDLYEQVKNVLELEKVPEFLRTSQNIEKDFSAPSSISSFT